MSGRLKDGAGRDITVILQGPIVPMTSDAIASVRKLLPSSEIIVSSWEGSSVDSLNGADKVVLSDDPGGHPTNFRPDPKRTNNENRLLVSTLAGLKAATRPFAVKMRTDTLLVHLGFLDFFDQFPARCEDWLCFEKRLVASTVFSRNPRRKFPYPLHPGDLFFFGQTRDLLTLWDIPLEPEEHYKWFATRARPTPDCDTESDQRYAPEQYLWTSMLSKFGKVSCDYQWDRNPDAIRQTELTFANNLILCSPEQLGYEWPGRPLAELDWLSIYGHEEWKRIYAKHCEKRFVWGADPETRRKLGILLNPLNDTKKVAKVQHVWNLICVWTNRIFVRAPRKVVKLLLRRPR